MAFLSLSYGAPISPNQRSFGTPGQTKVSGDRQRETTHKLCCLAAELAASQSLKHHQNSKFAFEEMTVLSKKKHLYWSLYGGQWYILAGSLLLTYIIHIRSTVLDMNRCNSIAILIEISWGILWQSWYLYYKCQTLLQEPKNTSPPSHSVKELSYYGKLSRTKSYQHYAKAWKISSGFKLDMWL